MRGITRDDMPGNPTDHLPKKPASVNQRFLILARNETPAARRLLAALSSLGRAEIILDVPTAREDRIWYPDEVMEGYRGLMGDSSPFPPITAWSRAFYHLSKTLSPDEAVWFVEDDVAGHPAFFGSLAKTTAPSNPDLATMLIHSKDNDGAWPNWHFAAPWFDDPVRAFGPLCRLSARLIARVLEFRETHGRFTFHEVLFPSLATVHGMRLLDWNTDPRCRHLFGTFRFRPVVDMPQPRINHPVKDACLHEAICDLEPEDTGWKSPRMGRAHLQGWSILADDYVFIAGFCRKNAIAQVVEFGPGDSTLAFLDAGCRVFSFESDPGWHERNSGRFNNEPAVELAVCLEGHLPEPGVIPFSPDLVMVDGPPHRPGQVMSRLPQCEWALENCGCFLLHDAGRAAERATLTEMKRRGMHVFEVHTEKGLALVVDAARRPEMLPATAACLMERYRGGSARGMWFTDDITAWSIWFQTARPSRILEIGSGNGLSANLLLDALFTHGGSEAHCVDDYEKLPEGVREDFLENAKRGGHESRLHLYEGTPAEILAWMIAGESYWESFDFIHLTGSPDPAEMLCAACQAWHLLKPGGMMVFNDAHKGGPRFRDLTNAFLDTYRELISWTVKGTPMICQKRIH